jgi:hypothetical protein
MGYRESCFKYISSSNNRNVADGQFLSFAASKNPEKAWKFSYLNIFGQNLSLAVPNFAARISGVIANVEVPGD